MHREEGRDRRNGLLGGGDAGLEVVELGVGAVLGCSDGVDDMRRSDVGGGLMVVGDGGDVGIEGADDALDGGLEFGELGKDVE